MFSAVFGSPFPLHTRMSLKPAHKCIPRPQPLPPAANGKFSLLGLVKEYGIKPSRGKLVTLAFADMAIRHLFQNR